MHPRPYLSLEATVEWPMHDHRGREWMICVKLEGLSSRSDLSLGVTGPGLITDWLRYETQGIPYGWDGKGSVKVLVLLTVPIVTETPVGS